MCRFDEEGVVRAIYLSEVVDQSQYTITEKAKLHHLLNVVRIRRGQNLMLLDGKGLKVNTSVEFVSRDQVHLKRNGTQFVENRSFLSVAFAQPKKEAFETCLRSCVEVGAGEIIILKSERSQNYPLKEARIHSILENALEQSNCPYFPEWNNISLEEVNFDKYSNVALSTLKASEETREIRGNCLLLIGPEGGFTSEEERYVSNYNQAFPLSFNGPILRTPTAISFFSSMVYSLSV